MLFVMNSIMLDEIIIFAALGILAGLLAGMFGIGGGLIIVPVLIGTFLSLGFENEIIVHLSIGTAISCIILPVWRQQMLIESIMSFRFTSARLDDRFLMLNVS